MMQASAQRPQPMHLSGSSRTPPPARRRQRVGGADPGAGRVVAGAADDHLEAALHAAHRADADAAGRPGRPRRGRRAQANMQHWQPTQRSVSRTLRRMNNLRGYFCPSIQRAATIGRSLSKPCRVVQRGSARIKLAPYALLSTRLSRITTTPRSVVAADQPAKALAKAQDRLRHRAYCAKGSSKVSLRAAKTGSEGTEKGRRTTTRQLSASPTTSTPSQKLRVPRSTDCGVLLKFSRIWRRAPSSPWA